jgi:PAS domain S-box-containing protein
MDEGRASGLGVIGTVPWGTHFCHFYDTAEDLLDLLVPYFAAGIEEGERCIWIVSPPLAQADALTALSRRVPDASGHLTSGRLVLMTPADLYFTDGVLVPSDVVGRIERLLADALALGFAGLRMNGTESWLRPRGGAARQAFLACENELDALLRGRRALVACTYPLDDVSASVMLDVGRSHQFVLGRRQGRWEFLQSPNLYAAQQELERLNRDLEGRVVRRTEELSAQREILQQILDHIPVMISLYDSNGRLLFVNHEWERQRGWTVQEVRSGALDVLAHSYPDPAEYARVRAHIDAATGEWADFTMAARDGRRIESRWATVRLSDGNRIAIGQDVTDWKRTEDELRNTYEQLRAIAANASSAREQEGLRISRELHDELGSVLTSLKWDLESVRDALARGGDEGSAARVVPKVDAIVRLAETLIGSVRRIAAELRPGILDDLGLVEALEWQCQQFQDRSGVHCELEVAVDDLPLTVHQSTALFRIFQEALTNVMRHAEATAVRVTVAVRDGYLVLSIRDNGKGISEKDRHDRASLGLAGMRERAVLMGGTLHVVRVPEGGTEVSARIPL